MKIVISVGTLAQHLNSQNYVVSTPYDMNLFDGSQFFHQVDFLLLFGQMHNKLIMSNIKIDNQKGDSSKNL